MFFYEKDDMFALGNLVKVVKSPFFKKVVHWGRFLSLRKLLFGATWLRLLLNPLLFKKLFLEGSIVFPPSYPWKEGEFEKLINDAPLH